MIVLQKHLFNSDEKNFNANLVKIGLYSIFIPHVKHLARTFNPEWLTKASERVRTCDIFTARGGKKKVGTWVETEVRRMKMHGASFVKSQTLLRNQIVCFNVESLMFSRRRQRWTDRRRKQTKQFDWDSRGDALFFFLYF